MKLPKNIVYGDKTYSEIELMKPRTSVLSDIQSSLKGNNDYYLAMYKFISGCIKSIADANGETVIDKNQIAAIVKQMPFKTAEYVATQIAIMMSPGDEIEGIYSCPRCGADLICELTGDSDSRDKLSDLKIIYSDDRSIHYDLINPVSIVVDSSTTQITSLDLFYPTLDILMKCAKKIGYKNEISLQVAVYTECLLKINNDDVDQKSRAMWGNYIFDNLDIKTDLKGIFLALSNYGYDHKVKKTCLRCGKIWNPDLNTSNFFESALRLN